MKHLKKFETHAEYVAYINGGGNTAQRILLR